MSPRRRTLLSLAVVALLVLAWCDPTVPWGAPPRCRIFVLDFSGSARPFAAERRARVRAAIADLGPGDLVGWVGFGERAAVGLAPAPCPAGFPAALEAPGPLGENASRPDLGVDLALSLAPAGARTDLVVVSDGRATGGDLDGVLRRAVERGIAVHTAPLGRSRFVDAAVTAVRGPSRPPADAPIDLVADLTATRACTGKVEWQVNGRPAGSSTVAFDGAGERSIRIRLPASAERVLDCRCAIAVAGEDPAFAFNDESGCVVVRRDVQRVALLSRRDPSHSIATWLRALPGVALTDARGEYDAVVLEDLPFADLGAEAAETLARAVESGAIGLLVTGGRQSFAAGGYAGTALERVLPVLSAPQESLALVLCLDRSGSMDDPGLPPLTKRETAVEASLAALGLLDGKDAAGVIAFHRLPETVWPLAPFTGVRGMREALESLHASGETCILPAVREAQRLLAGVAGKRHVLLLTDGQTEEPRAGFKDAAQRLAAAGVTFSAVAIGGDSVTPEDFAKLQTLSAAGGAGSGRTYRIEKDLRELPGLLEEDLKLHKGFFHEGESATAAATDSAWVGDPPGPVGGWVRTRLKSEARADLASSATSEPLAASWMAGLGRAVALTTDPTGAWTQGWQDAGAAGRLTADALRWVLPKEDPRGLAISAAVEAGESVLNVEAGEGVDPQALLDLRARLLEPGGGGPREVELAPETPRRRCARASTAAPGVYRWTLVRGDAPAGTASVYGANGREWLRLGADLAALSDWAAEGGGALLTGPGVPAARSGAGAAERRVPLRAWLQGLALALLFAGPALGWWKRRK